MMIRVLLNINTPCHGEHPPGFICENITMITATDIALSYGKRVIFKDVNIKFTPGNCYGLIGANGAGKSTFLKILSNQLDPDSGHISKGRGQRISVLNQDQFAFDDYTVFDTVIMGHEKLYKVMAEREALYTKTDFTDEDGIRSGELEAKFGEMNGYEAEAEAGVLLNGLGIPEELSRKRMKPRFARSGGNLRRY